MHSETAKFPRTERALLAAGIAVAVIAGVGALLLAWARSPWSGGEVALGVIAAFWFGGWLVVEPLAFVGAYVLLGRRARTSELRGVTRMSLVAWALLVLLQYLALKATGDGVFLDLARRAFTPAHLLSAAVCGAVAVSHGRARRAFAAMAGCLVVLAAGDEVSFRSHTWLPAWAALAATAVFFSATAFRATRPAHPVTTRNPSLGASS